MTADYISRCQDAMARQNASFFTLCAGLVLDAVHPGNLGALPPSPWVIKTKAVQLGLAKRSEFDRLPNF